jgi:pyruvate formate lyase activating enzyme
MAESISIKGFIETSFIDWKGHLASVVFTGGCNFRCPYCHNGGLVLNPANLEDIPPEHVFLTLKKYKNWVEHVVITGGEPTIHEGLPSFLAELKSRGLMIKLDTNGSNFPVVKRLVSEGLVDYIAMDIKGPTERYERWCGVETDTAVIEKSIDFILEGNVDYEFRMTVVPFLHREEDVYQAAERVSAARRFFIQEFRPISTLNPTFAQIRPFSPHKITRIRQTVAEILRSAQRGTELGQ